MTTTNALIQMVGNVGTLTCSYVGDASFTECSMRCVRSHLQANSFPREGGNCAVRTCEQGCIGPAITNDVGNDAEGPGQRASARQSTTPTMMSKSTERSAHLYVAKRSSMLEGAVARSSSLYADARALQFQMDITRGDEQKTLAAATARFAHVQKVSKAQAVKYKFQETVGRRKPISRRVPKAVQLDSELCRVTGSGQEARPLHMACSSKSKKVRVRPPTGRSRCSTQKDLGQGTYSSRPTVSDLHRN